MKRSQNPRKRAIPSIRERIATALLFQRLGLEDDWQDPEFQIMLPSLLPPNGGRPFAPDVLREIDAGLRALESVGCRRRGMYWCLGQLGAQAESLRQGWRVKTVLHNDESKNRAVPEKPPLATREDMASVAKKIRSAAEAVLRYRTELLLVADVCVEDLELPSSGFTCPEGVDDALSLLLNSLAWATELAVRWESPNAAALIKSKGVLFIMAYVWIGTKTNNSGTKRRRGPKPSRRRSTYRLPRAIAQQVDELIHAYAGVGYGADELNDKLHDFATGEPEAFTTLVALVEKIHLAASLRT